MKNPKQLYRGENEHSKRFNGRIRLCQRFHKTGCFPCLIVTFGSLLNRFHGCIAPNWREFTGLGFASSPM